MRLARLEMLGFKSFMNKADLRFEEGITSVLGPNGCGKSNIVDALRWVLGEQSAKLLRGSKMENVIFQGTKNRPPMGIAEVTLTFTGASETLPVDWDEISIKRRVSRGGGSEYFLNGQPHRLRDINDLLAGSGIGNHVYAIIEQDMVKSLLADNGEKRRILFEEASGILRYKMRRKESLSKLASVEGDLTRLDDILDELGRNVRSLKVQMGRARSYQKLQAELGGAEIFSSSVKLHDMWIRDRELGRRLEGMGDENLGDDTRLATGEEELEKLQTALLEEESAYQDGRNSLEREAEALRKREEEVAVLEEKARSEGRRAEGFEEEIRRSRESLDRLDLAGGELSGRLEEEESKLSDKKTLLGAEESKLGEIAARYQERRKLLEKEKQLQLDFVQSRAEAGGEVERLGERIQQTRENLKQLEDEAAQMKIQGGELNEQLRAPVEALAALDANVRGKNEERLTHVESLRQAEATLESCRGELQALQMREGELGARLELLEGLREERAGYSEGTRSLLEAHGGESGVLGPLADALRVDEEDRLVVELTLGRALGAVAMEDPSRGLPWLGELAEGASGRALLLDLGGEEVSVKHISGMTPLIDLVDTDAALKPALSRLLGDAHLAPDPESALAAAREYPTLRFATRDGFLAEGRGLSEGGSQAAATAPLGREEEIEKLQNRLEELAKEKQSAEKKSGAASVALDDRRAGLTALDVELSDLAKRHAELDLEKARLETRLLRLHEEEQGLAAEREVRGRQEKSLGEALAEAEQTLLKLSGLEKPESNDLPALEIEVASLEKQRDGEQARIAEMRLELAALGGDLENLRLREENRRREVGDQEARFARAGEGLSESQRASSEARERSAFLREGMKDEQDSLATRRAKSDTLLEDIQSRREEIQGKQQEVKLLREQRHEHEQALHQLEIERNTLAVRMDNIREILRENHKVEPDASEDPAQAEDCYEAPEGKSLEDAIDELREKIRRLGNVNLLALEEYEEKNERYEFLLAQKEDLITARDGLLETIRRINREARQRFDETFQVVRTNFIEIFKAVFEGGEADLSYSTEDDPLQADIIVTAKPKEKKIADISQLSSGEKTLTALSILFAIYLSKPSPFCVFDEVDAPLDDANIARFLRLLRQFSERTQFILITHNKKTMEVAKHLYGVTMEESGVSKIVSVAFDEVPDDLDKEPLVVEKGA